MNKGNSGILRPVTEMVTPTGGAIKPKTHDFLTFFPSKINIGVLVKCTPLLVLAEEPIVSNSADYSLTVFGRQTARSGHWLRSPVKPLRLNLVKYELPAAGPNA